MSRSPKLLYCRAFLIRFVSIGELACYVLLSFKVNKQMSWAHIGHRPHSKGCGFRSPAQMAQAPAPSARVWQILVSHGFVRSGATGPDRRVYTSSGVAARRVTLAAWSLQGQTAGTPVK